MSNWYSSSWETHLRATGHQLSYEIEQCYLPPNTGKYASTPARLDALD